jgi:hypothetical protein
MQPCPNTRHDRNLHGPHLPEPRPVLPNTSRLSLTLLFVTAAIAACSSATGPSNVSGTWVQYAPSTSTPLSFVLNEMGDSLTGTWISDGYGYVLGGHYTPPHITIDVTTFPNWSSWVSTVGGRVLGINHMKLFVGPNPGDSADFVRQ